MTWCLKVETSIILHCFISRGKKASKSMALKLPFPVRFPFPPPHRFTAAAAFSSLPLRSLSGASPSLRQQPAIFLRPLVYSASNSELGAFRRWAESLALAAGPRLAASDGGPDADLLRRELAWLIQDASAEEHPIDAAEVRLRVSLEELYRLWEERIEKRRPFQYIVGCEHWRDLVLVVKEGVLIPRPETEMVVDMVKEVKGFEEGSWADLGTGSGAIAVGIARMLGKSGRVFATDLSPIAAEVASLNVERYGLKDKVEVRQGFWFEPLQDVRGRLTGLVSNPPYIPSSHIAGLQAEVGKHEPRLALDGGEDGMDHLLHLCKSSASALKPNGFFAFETNGDEQSEYLADFMSKKMGNLFHKINVVLDFAGIKRFVTGFRR